MKVSLSHDKSGFFQLLTPTSYLTKTWIHLFPTTLQYLKMLRKHHFYTPWTKSENQRFCTVFRGCRNGELITFFWEIAKQDQKNSNLFFLIVNLFYASLAPKGYKRIHFCVTQNFRCNLNFIQKSSERLFVNRNTQMTYSIRYRNFDGTYKHKCN